MKLVETKEDVIKNIQQVEYYLLEGTDSEAKEISDYIKRGVCFIAYKIENSQIAFVPSKFIGQFDNTLEKHARKEYFGGQITTPALVKILKEEEKHDSELEEVFLSYCNIIGVKPYAKKRRYWRSLLNEDLFDKTDNSISNDFWEGKELLKIHKLRERNPEVVKIAKQNFKDEHGGKLYCQACGFNFKDKYGEIGDDFIEGHHTIPLKIMEKKGGKTNPKDIALLCSNCHRIVHRKKEWLTIDELSNLIKINGK